jgi:hypothetical protein
MYAPDNTASSILSDVIGKEFSIPYQSGVTRAFRQDSAILTLSVSAPGYFWQGVYMVMGGISDNVVNVSKLTSNLILNTAGYGDMTVSQGTNYNIRVTNPATAIGTKCNYSLQYLHGLIPQS